MANNVQVRFNFKPFQNALKSISSDSQTQTLVGKTIVQMIKDLISKGISPVRGFGRFIGYSAQRGNKKGYPRDNNTKNKYPDKNVRPVNLKLSGKMLESLTYKLIGSSIIVGIFGDKDIKDRAKAHQEGTSKVPQRKFLPTNAGEKLNISIMREIKGIYLRKIKSIIKGL